VNVAKKISREDIENILEEISDPIKFGIIIEMLRKPDSSPLEIKKKLGIKGSRIYYYLNQLKERKLVKETVKEEVTSHLKRSKYQITSNFIEFLKMIRHDPKHNSLYYHFQLIITRSILDTQIRILEKTPKEEYKHIVPKEELAGNALFFITETEIEQILKWRSQLTELIKRDDGSHFNDWIGDTTHIAVLGIYAMD
jgi:DNA-binding PadR family transcriptional regulator